VKQHFHRRHQTDKLLVVDRQRPGRRIDRRHDSDPSKEAVRLDLNRQEFLASLAAGRPPGGKASTVWRLSATAVAAHQDAQMCADCQKECEKFPDVAECKACGDSCKTCAEDVGKVAA
jgi:hypothetical protein